MRLVAQTTKLKTLPRAWLLVPIVVTLGIGLGVGTGYWLRSSAPGQTSIAAPDESAEADLSAPEPLGPEGGRSASRGSTARGPNGWLRSVLGRALASDQSDAGLGDGGALAKGVLDAGRALDAEETPKPERHRPGVYERDGWLSFFLPLPPAARTASIQGVVSQTARQVELPPLQRGEQFGCPRAPATDPSLVVDDGRLANAVVFVHVLSITERDRNAFLSALRERKSVTLEDTGCMLEPHVSLSVSSIHNADATFHRIQGFSGGALLFDSPLYAGTTIGLRHLASTGPTALKCAVHPWESAYVFHARGPFAMLTGPDGAFRFEGIPNNETYIVEAWHERFGSQQISVQVLDGPATVDFTFGAQATAAK
jgi:hypothetical protein